MGKLIAAAVLLGIVALDLVLGWYFAKAALVTNAILALAGAAAVVYVQLPTSDRGNAMEDPYGVALLMLLVAGTGAVVIGAVGFGWAWWVLR